MEMIWTNLKEIIAVIATLSVIVEIVPIKINPWSAILRWIGKKCNGELYARIDKVEESVKKIQEENAEREQEKQEQQAKVMRSDIIRFASKCKKDRAIIDEWEFQDMFSIIDNYTEYCEKHKIPNHYIDEQVEFIHDYYSRRTSE